MSETDPSAPLSVTGCTYDVLDKDTGSRHRCGKKTVSDSYPFCYQHVTKIGSPSDRRFKRYENNMPAHVREKYVEQLRDDSPGNLVPELANLRTLLNVHYERIANTITPEGRVEVTNKDLAIILELVDSIRRVVETHSKVNPDRFVPVSDVEHILMDMIEIIRSSIPHDQVQLRETIATKIYKYCMEELNSHVVDPGEGKGRGPTQ